MRSFSCTSLLARAGVASDGRNQGVQSNRSVRSHQQRQQPRWQLLRLRAQAADAPDEENTDRPAPWNIGIYVTKRTNRMQTGPLGEIPEETEDTLLTLPGWNAAGKQKLAAQVVAQELGVEPALIETRLEQLLVLLPDLAARIGTMRTADLCRLAMRVPDVAAALVKLRSVFPKANVAKMCAIQPDLLSQDPQDVAASLARLRLLMPNVDVEDIVSVAPRVLNVDKTAAGLAELERLMPGADIQRLVYADPDMLMSVQKGDDLIPYDNGTLAQIKARARQLVDVPSSTRSNHSESLAGGPNAAPDGW